MKATTRYYDEEVIEQDLEALKQDLIIEIERATSGKELELGKLVRKIPDLKVLSNLLLNDDQVKSQLENIKSICLPPMRSDNNSKANTREEKLDFLSSLGKGGFFLNRTVEKQGTLSSNEIATLEILTSQKMSENLRPKPKVEIDLIKTFYKHLITKSPDSYLNEFQELISITKTEVETENKVSLKYAHALRILSEFNWLNLTETYFGLQSELSKIFSAQQVKTESYHYEQAPDLHFYMTKVTQKNIKYWEDFGREQSAYDREFNASKNAAGLCAFGPSLDFFDWASTDAWIAFISSEPQDLNKIYKYDIEMLVPMITPEKSLFTSHSGIARCGTYLGKMHKGVSPDLHSFVTKITQMHYQTTNKEYMITCPTDIMGKIIISSLEKHDFHNKFYIGFEDRNALLISEEHYPIKNDPVRKSMVERICKQNVKITNGERIPPINIKMGEDTLKLSYNQSKEESNKCLSFTVNDNKGNVIESITPDQMNGPDACFFTHPHLFEGLSFTHDENLLTVNIESLSQLLSVNPDQIEYKCKVETVGDVALIS